MYADLNGKPLAVTRTEDGSPLQYQVWLDGKRNSNTSICIMSKQVAQPYPGPSSCIQSVDIKNA